MAELNIAKVEGLDNVTSHTFLLPPKKVASTQPNRYRSPDRINLYLDLSVVPAAGTMAIKVRPFGSEIFRTYATVDLTGADLDYEILAIGIDAVRTVPSALSAGTTYSAFLFQREE